MSEHLATLDDIESAKITSVYGDGIEVVLRRSSGDDIVVYESPSDMLYEQLVDEGIISP